MAEVETEEDAAVPDAAVVSLLDAVSHALDSKPSQPIPLPLPTGWVIRESRSQPNYYFYYNMETGISTWQSPIVPHHLHQQQQQESFEEDDMVENTVLQPDDAEIGESSAEDANTAAIKVESRKRTHQDDTEDIPPTAAKKSKSSSGKPSKVRILHILKKHKDSRRPSSWRQPKITASKEEATEELKGLMELLKEESGEDQRATFEELARTESDCSSAKRGGDLGFFGPKKMQPAFEEASFKLAIGELSGVVETSSGVHVLLRIG
jgi:peptidyl-prolyl cis-trans isomerase NIMA-interacting 1